MSSIQHFEELRCWKSARELSRLIHKLTMKEKFARDFALVNQIRNSSGSGMDNIAEGFDRAGNKEFLQFLSVARGSISETKSQLYRALDHHCIDNDEFQHAYNLATQTIKETTSLIVYLKKSDKKGFKFS